MKKLIALILAVLMLSLPVLSLAEEAAYNPAGFIDWINESNLWMTVANGHWSTDPADKITDEELEAIFSVATKQQNAVHWTPWYFIVIKDTEEQQKILGAYWDKPENEATDGTVTVLCLADQILTQDEGHATPYEDYYMPTTFAYYDSGLTCSLLGVAAAALGYQTHYFGSIYGEYAPKDLADGKYQSMNRYVSESDLRTWGYMGTTYPVKGNCVFVCALVIGKPAAGETIETWGSNHVRPANWKIWDGTDYSAAAPAAEEAVSAFTFAPAPEAPATEETPAAEEEPATEEAPSAEEEPAAEEAPAADGLTATAAGFTGGDVTVTVTLDDEGKIATLVIDAESQTPGFGQRAMEDEFIAQFIGKALPVDAGEIDAIGGATITTNAVLEALNSLAK